MGVSGITSAMISTIVRIGIEALKTHLKHEEAVIKTLKSLGIPTEPEDNFDSIYIHTLVRYGIFKPEEILNFFRNEHIRKAFQQSYSKGDPNILLKEAEGIIDWNYETNKLGQIDYDPRLEFKEFTEVYDKIVDSLQKPTDVKRDLMLKEILDKVTRHDPEIRPDVMYDPKRITNAPYVYGEEGWTQGKLIYQLRLSPEEDIQAIKTAISGWRFVTTSSHQSVEVIDGILGLGQTSGSTFNLSPVGPIDNCSVECDVLINECSDDQTNWAGISVRSFDFVLDFRLGYLVYLRRSGQVELYGPEGILAGSNKVVVQDPSTNWTHLRIDIIDSEIRVYVNGTKHFTVVDKTFGGRGRIYLYTFGTHAKFKNLKVYELEKHA